MTQSLLVDTPGGLDDLIDQLEQNRFVAVDTEFVRERTYYPNLCLVQVANDTVVACVDTLKLDDLGSLWRLLRNAKSLKVLHSARQDLEILFQESEAVPAPVFDTQIAAGFLGRGGQTGYAALIKDMLGITIDKSQVRTDWSRRPLTTAQLEYAAADVEHLVTVYHRLRDELESRGRSAWARHEFENLTRTELYRIDPELSWKRVKGSRRLGGTQLACLKHLAAWREHRAIEHNRPKQWILKDALLTELARRSPTTVNELRSIEGLPPAVIRREGQRLVECCNQPTGRAADEPVAYKPLNGSQKRRLGSLMELVKASADESGISPELLATRRELEKLVRGQRQIPVLTGWRYDLAGKKLLENLSGTASS